MFYTQWNNSKLPAPFVPEGDVEQVPVHNFFSRQIDSFSNFRSDLSSMYDSYGLDDKDFESFRPVTRPSSPVFAKDKVDAYYRLFEEYREVLRDAQKLTSSFSEGKEEEPTPPVPEDDK